jgi:hypothetical protein
LNAWIKAGITEWVMSWLGLALLYRGKRP